MGNINISDIDVIRAWKDKEYRNSLSEEQKALLSLNPAGEIDLADLSNDQSAGVKGGIQFRVFTESVCHTVGITPYQCGGYVVTSINAVC